MARVRRSNALVCSVVSILLLAGCSNSTSGSSSSGGNSSTGGNGGGSSGSVSHNVWTWVGGTDTVNSASVSGTQGVGSTSNIPSARTAATAWTATSGAFWLFGGQGSDGAGTSYLYDLWSYTPSNSQWTLVAEAGSGGMGVYGTRGASSDGGTPGVRDGSAGWKDGLGNYWLFGGYGLDTNRTDGQLSDLWVYTPSTSQWTWVDGPNTINAVGVYGTQGTGTASTLPGGRNGSANWTDASGNYWLFGGYGYDENGTLESLNDLWEYTPAPPLAGQWTWMSGSATGGAAGIYGTQGVPTAGNVPTARNSAASWTDASGNFWLFGGSDFIVVGQGNTQTLLNDLWKYSPSTGEWTWVSGSSTGNASGIYGTQSAAASANVPGARYSAASWMDASGNLWLLGGNGMDSTGAFGYLNDLWKYTVSTGQWTWVGGSETISASGVYGTQGAAASADVPGARSASVSWTDSSGNLWLFGGFGLDSTATSGYLNDLWKYTP